MLDFILVMWLMDVVAGIKLAMPAFLLSGAVGGLFVLMAMDSSMFDDGVADKVSMIGRRTLIVSVAMLVLIIVLPGKTTRNAIIAAVAVDQIQQTEFYEAATEEAAEIYNHFRDNVLKPAAEAVKHEQQ